MKPSLRNTVSTASVMRCWYYSVKVAPRGRGRQCNAGAASASGDVLVFLHADTRLPDGAFLMLEKVPHNAEAKLGSFRISFAPNHWFLKLFCFLTRFDPGVFRFGDQCLVVRQSLFRSLGGFPEQNLFEDLAFVLKARSVTLRQLTPAQVGLQQ